MNSKQNYKLYRELVDGDFNDPRTSAVDITPAMDVGYRGMISWQHFADEKRFQVFSSVLRIRHPIATELNGNAYSASVYCNGKLITEYNGRRAKKLFNHGRRAIQSKLKTEFENIK